MSVNRSLAMLFLITSHGVVASAQSTGNNPVVMTGPVGARLDSALTILAGQGMSGVILVSKDGTVLFNKGYGAADRAAATPLGPNSIVQIGSNTKDFTAVAILQLVERGRLNLKDSLGQFFHEVPADKSGITVEQLLNHRGGFDRQLGGDFETVSKAEMLANAFRAPLIAPPGTRQSYSNTGYALLAAIIESVTGRSYDEHVREAILKPLHLEETGFLLPNFSRARLVHGYRDGADQGMMLDKAHLPDGPYWNLRGNGGMLSTTLDMARFYRALFFSDALLKPASIAVKFAPSGPRMLAGSDLVHFFLYGGGGADGYEFIFALNDMAIQPPKIQAAVDEVLGRRGPGGGNGPGQVVTTGGPPRSTAAGVQQETTAQAPFNLPETKIGQLVQRYFRAYNQGQAALMQTFLEESAVPNPDRPIAQRVAGYVEMHKSMGFLTPLAILAASETELSLKVKSVYEGEITMKFMIEAGAPFRLTGLQVEAGNRGPNR